MMDSYEGLHGPVVSHSLFYFEAKVARTRRIAYASVGEDRLFLGGSPEASTEVYVKAEVKLGGVDFAWNAFPGITPGFKIRGAERNLQMRSSS